MWAGNHEKNVTTFKGLCNLGVTVSLTKSRLHGPQSRVWAQLDGAWDDPLVCTVVLGALHGDHQETINRSHTSGKRLYRRRSTHRSPVDDEY